MLEVLDGVVEHGGFVRLAGVRVAFIFSLIFTERLCTSAARALLPAPTPTTPASASSLSPRSTYGSKPHAALLVVVAAHDEVQVPLVHHGARTSDQERRRARHEPLDDWSPAGRR